MGSIQDKVGRIAEKDVEKLFSSHGYWALLVQKGPNGQPFDLIAIKEKENKVYKWFVDVKHLRGKVASFTFDRIEANQLTSMKYARSFAGIKDNLGFVITPDLGESRYLYLPYDKLIEMKEKGLKSVKIADLENFEELLYAYNNK